MDKNIIKSAILIALLFSNYFVFAQTMVDLEGVQPSRLKTTIETNTAKLFDRINTAFQENADNVNYEGIKMTDDAKVTIDQLWETSHFMIQELEIYEKLLKKASSLNNNAYEIRNIGIFIKDADEGEKNKQAVILFDKQGNINDFYISIGYKLYKDVMIKGKSIKDFRKREIVLDFVENFRTAYNRKDSKFIESVFSDDALIIVGHVVKKLNPDGGSKVETTEYIVKSKKEYMQKLKRAFRTNKYINVDFSELKVVRHAQFPYMYGVTVKQKWKSDRYSDEGFVFLLIDLRDENKPIIHIRTWDKKDTFNLNTFQLGGM
jgi:hypothetical protein